MIQLQVLNFILKTKDFSFIINNNIDKEYFSDYTKEFLYILNHFNQYNSIPDLVTFLNVFPDFDVIEVTENEKYLLDALVEDKNKRFLATVFNKIRNLINEDKTNEALDLYTTTVNEAVLLRPFKAVDILKDTSRYDDYVERCNDYSKYYVRTGFDELDQLIGGWDRYEELATIAARPGIGKSWVLLKCAVAALEQGLTVGIYSGEMSERKVGYRFDTLVSHISNYGITKGNVSIQNQYKMYIDTIADKYKGTIKVLTPNMINGVAGVNSLRAFIERENLDILFVDQHSLLEDDRKAKNPVEKAANISRDLKNLQVLKRIPIIAVSQQNRSSVENGVDSSNIAQTDRISQDSTVIIFLEQKDNVLTLYLSKSRDSETNKKIKYAIDLDKGIFNYICEDNNAVNGAGAEELAQEFEESPFQ